MVSTKPYVASPADRSLPYCLFSCGQRSKWHPLNQLLSEWRQLLAAVTLGRYETDLRYGHLALIYHASKGSAKEISALDQAPDSLFGADCNFQLGVQAWKTDKQQLVKTSRAPESAEEEPNDCVKEGPLVVFDLTKDTVDPDRGKNKKKESK